MKLHDTGIEEIDDYCRKVYNKKIPACEPVRQAVKRHYRDLARQETDDFPFYFEPEAAQHLFDYFTHLRHWKGRWKGEAIHLQPWQKFVLGSIFGWLEVGTKVRRFREAYIEIPRKNGKTTMIAGVGLYGIDYDNEPGAEVYSAATTRDQAKILWGDAKAFINASRSLREVMKIREGTSTISCNATNGFFRPLSKDHGRLDGLNVHFSLHDELHAWPNRDLYDVLDDATGSRDQPLILNITTAGSNREGICYETRNYVTKILSRTISDERYFGIVYTVDEADKKSWDDPQVWKKANPNYDISVFAEDFERLAAKARESQAKKNDFLTKRLNIWVTSFTAWMNMDLWISSAKKQPYPTMKDLRGEKCYAGLDLASKDDLTDIRLLFYKNKRYATIGRTYLPEDVVSESISGPRAVYNAWAEKGLLTLTPGNITDYEYIYEDLLKLSKQYNILHIGYDPWQAYFLIQKLQKKRFKVKEVRQTNQVMSEPMKTLEAWAKAGKLEHYNDPILRWAISNVVAKYDRRENISPTKENRDNKIDPAVALIMAVALELNDPIGGKPEKKRKPKIHKV